MFRKRLAAAAAVLMVAGGLFMAAPATAQSTGGTWQPQSSSFTIPSNWHCGPTVSSSKVSAQICLVRSGNYVQAASIFRNRTNSPVIVEMTQGLNYDLGGGTCSASGMAAQGVSVCFTSTVYDPNSQQASGWSGLGTSGHYGFRSPWA